MVYHCRRSTRALFPLSQTMSILRNKASIENTPGELALRSPSRTLWARPTTTGGITQGRQMKAQPAYVGKRLDQEMGFLNGGITYFKARSSAVAIYLQIFS